MKIAFIGNFEVPYSTESHHAWTWRKLGHDVIQLQENRTSVGEVMRACDNADLFQWTHTHGWGIQGEADILHHVKERGTPSFSYHLDRYFGIGSRQADYLSHPSFHLDYFFSTDGGNEEGWKQAGVNHVYLPPGVVEYGTHMGVSSSGYAIPVLFCGSVGYHGEWPFRPAMVQALQRNYGPRFQVRNGVREEALNNLYASATVCVGDHIFAGCRHYCSDRLFETIGRGGFIIYPETEGVTESIPGLVTYHPQDIDDLIHKTDYYLDLAHEAERIERRDAAFQWVKTNGTYTNRLTSILQTMGLA